MKNYIVEVGDDEASLCKCCNKESFNGHGFVYCNGDAHAVYYVTWSLAHFPKKVSFALAIGEWSDESTIEDRDCFGIEAREMENQIVFQVLEPAESPWPNTNLLGPMIDRSKALTHPKIKETFDILETILRSHVSIKDYLNLKP